MRVLDTSDMDVVYFGREWPHPDVDPSSRACVAELERNEGLVTWLQPRGGSVDDQIPAIRVGGKYCALSLRMQKSLFRHVRLRKDFINREPMSNGSFKLRIPLLLMQEKVMRKRTAGVANDGHHDPSTQQGEAQPLQPLHGSDVCKRGISMQSKSIDNILKSFILPMADRISSLPPLTVFSFTEQDSLASALEDVIARDCPSLCSDKRVFMEAMSSAYDEFTHSRSPHAPLGTVGPSAAAPVRPTRPLSP